ncbi:MAG: nucleotide exchange factor GrpE [Bacteroidetes bacterium]|nr:nucleotide exchange factor GrpE [Bacteroidota bacterium]
MKQENINQKEEQEVLIDNGDLKQFSEENPNNEVEELLSIEELKSKNAELLDLLIRRTAEFDNYRKRTTQEKADLLEYGNTRVFTALIDILDDLRNANESAKKHQDITSIQAGVEMIYQKTDKFFREQGVKMIEVSIGDDFDVNFHSALMSQTSHLPEGKITMVLQNGYLFKDKVIRYTQVATSSGNE